MTSWRSTFNYHSLSLETSWLGATFTNAVRYLRALSCGRVCHWQPYTLVAAPRLTLLPPKLLPVWSDPKQVHTMFQLDSSGSSSVIVYQAIWHFGMQWPWNPNICTCTEPTLVWKYIHSAPTFETQHPTCNKEKQDNIHWSWVFLLATTTLSLDSAYQHPHRRNITNKT